jgi:hypothetical protein
MNPNFFGSGFLNMSILKNKKFLPLIIFSTYEMIYGLIVLK